MYYLNLLRATNDILAGRSTSDTILSVASPLDGVVVSPEIKVEWYTIGVAPKTITLAVDGKVLVTLPGRETR